jgi:hypothetical protein
MLEAEALVAPTLPFAVSLHRLGVGLPVRLLIAGVLIAPPFAAVPDDLSVKGIGAKLAPLIIPAALSLAGGLATDGLLGTIGAKLEDLLAVTAMAITHQAAPDQNAIRSFCPELLQLSLAALYRNCYRVFYRVSAHGVGI